MPGFRAAMRKHAGSPADRATRTLRIAARLECPTTGLGATVKERLAQYLRAPLDRPSGAPLAQARIVIQDHADQLDHARAVIRSRGQVRGLLERGQRVGDGHRKSAPLEERVIVFRVSDSHHVVLGDAKAFQRHLEPGHFSDGRRQNHHRALVEGHVQLQAQVADHFQHGGFIRTPRGNNRIAHRNRFDTASPQVLDQRGGRSLGQQLFFSRRRIVNHGAILRHHPVEQGEPRKNGRQIGQFPAGHQDEPAAGLPQPFQRANRFRVHLAVASQGSIVIRRQRDVSHDPQLIDARKR